MKKQVNKWIDNEGSEDSNDLIREETTSKKIKTIPQ